MARSFALLLAIIMMMAHVVQMEELHDDLSFSEELKFVTTAVIIDSVTDDVFEDNPKDRWLAFGRRRDHLGICALLLPLAIGIALLAINACRRNDDDDDENYHPLNCHDAGLVLPVVVGGTALGAATNFKQQKINHCH